MDDSCENSADSDELLGATIARRYRIVSLLARGGMSKVFKAEQRALERLVVLKVLTPGYNGNGDPEFARRFALEASSAAKLTHPNTVTIFDFGRCSNHGIYFIAMEYLRGRTLQQVLAEEHVLSEARAVAVAEQVARSLAEAHRMGVAHRDLKPSNVLMLDEADVPNFVKVLDFGLVKDISGQGENLTGSGLFLGSPKYMSPEQITAGEITPRTDVYMLGVMLYEMLCGQVPFGLRAGFSTLVAHVSEAPPPLGIKNPDVVVCDDLSAIVMRCLAKAPGDRFASMPDLIHALRQLSNLAQRPRLAPGVSSRDTSVDSRPPLPDPSLMAPLVAELEAPPPRPRRTSPPVESVPPESSLAVMPSSAPGTLRVPVRVGPSSAPDGADSLSPRTRSARPTLESRFPHGKRSTLVVRVVIAAAIFGSVGIAVGIAEHLPRAWGGGFERRASSPSTPEPALPLGVASATVPEDAGSAGQRGEPRFKPAAAPMPPTTPAPSSTPAPPTIRTSEVWHYREGMSHPSLISAPDVILSPEAIAAKAHGTALATCVITTAGTIVGCRVIKSVPFTDEAVTTALEARRYRPIFFRGKAVAVEYGFAVHITAP